MQVVLEKGENSMPTITDVKEYLESIDSNPVEATKFLEITKVTCYYNF